MTQGENKVEQAAQNRAKASGLPRTPTPPADKTSGHSKKPSPKSNSPKTPSPTAPLYAAKAADASARTSQHYFIKEVVTAGGTRQIYAGKVTAAPDYSASGTPEVRARLLDMSQANNSSELAAIRDGDLSGLKNFVERLIPLEEDGTFNSGQVGQDIRSQLPPELLNFSKPFDNVDNAFPKAGPAAP